jgi:drug/metabolite transporter (DMT)-like permease
MKTEQHYKQEFDMEQFVKGLKKEDTRYLALTNTFKWIMFVLAPFYFLIFVLGMIIDHPEIDKFGFLFFSLGFLAFALLFKSLHHEYNSVDYGVSTIEMLRKAVSRYALWQPKTYLTIIPVLLCAIGFSFSAQKGFPFEDQTIRILVGFGSILFVMCCSGLVGYFIWRKRQKPLRDKALELLREMGE